VFFYKETSFLVSSDLSGEPPASRNSGPDSREPHWTFPVVAPDYSGLRPACRGILPASREPHRTCSVVVAN
jgi:hypothetical protein